MSFEHDTRAPGAARSRIVAVFSHPALAACCLFALILDFAGLPVQSYAISDVGLMTRGSRMSGVHLRSFPVDIVRTKGGITVIPEAAGPWPADLEVTLILPRVYEKRTVAYGFWGLTRQRTFHVGPDQSSLSEAEWAQLPSQLVPVLRGLGYDEDDLALLERGVFEESRPRLGGYAHNALAILLALVTLVSLAMIASHFWIKCRKDVRLRRGLCPRCGYDLRYELLAGCSECGWQRLPVGSSFAARR